jgi:hypothetical protein
MLFKKKEEPKKRKVVEKDTSFKATLKKSHKYVSWVGSQFPAGQFELLDSNKVSETGQQAAASRKLDYHFKHTATGKKFWIECRFRQHLDSGNKLSWTTPEQLAVIKAFKKKKKDPVFLILAHSGFPAQPRELFVVPLGVVREASIAVSKMEKYKRKDPLATFQLKDGKVV